MSQRYQHYRWWLLDGDLEIVSDGKVRGASLPAALDRLGGLGKWPSRRPYSSRASSSSISRGPAWTDARADLKVALEKSWAAFEAEIGLGH